MQGQLSVAFIPRCKGNCVELFLVSQFSSGIIVDIEIIMSYGGINVLERKTAVKTKSGTNSYEQKKTP